jgi:hypothetical protein
MGDRQRGVDPNVVNEAVVQLCPQALGEQVGLTPDESRQSGSSIE